MSDPIEDAVRRMLGKASSQAPLSIEQMNRENEETVRLYRSKLGWALIGAGLGAAAGAVVVTSAPNFVGFAGIAFIAAGLFVIGIYLEWGRWTL